MSKDVQSFTALESGEGVACVDFNQLRGWHQPQTNALTCCSWQYTVSDDRQHMHVAGQLDALSLASYSYRYMDVMRDAL